MAKKLYSFLSFWLLVWTVAWPQTVENFRVVRVVGTVESFNLKRALRAEDVIPAGDLLRFLSSTDYIIVFHAKEGRKRIMGVPDNQPRELNILLQSFVKPDEKSTGTRGGDHAYIEKLQADLQDTVLILGNGTIALDPAHLSVSPPGSIKAQYKTKDKKSVIITVSSGQSLHLDKKSLFPASQVPTSRILLLYFTKESSSPLDAQEFLGNFSPLYADDASLVPEIRSIVESLKGQATQDIEKEIKEYLTQEYAKPMSLQLTAWLKSNHLLVEP